MSAVLSLQVQTRSADEPMTTFVFCNECGNRWKVGWSPCKSVDILNVGQLSILITFILSVSRKCIVITIYKINNLLFI